MLFKDLKFLFLLGNIGLQFILTDFILNFLLKTVHNYGLNEISHGGRRFLISLEGMPYHLIFYFILEILFISGP